MRLEERIGEGRRRGVVEESRKKVGGEETGEALARAEGIGRVCEQGGLGREAGRR